MLYQGSIHYPVGKLVIYLSNNKSMGFYTEGPIFREVGLMAYTRMGLYLEVFGISIVFHCFNQATAKPIINYYY
jgi:hypothetical protein